jgi:sulfatase maturation enzyme AslB (radical SAM superfamily)
MTALRRANVLLVLLLSRRCNLQCHYCNVDAGPSIREPQLSLQQVDDWARAFAALGPVDLCVQLHGGEPLLVDPPIELYAATIRNAVAAFPQARVVDVLAQSNGALLSQKRLEQLTRANVRVNISIDGPASIHNRFRVTAAGKPSFAKAIAAAEMLRDRNLADGVISVVTDPDDVLPAIQYFMAEGFGGARMNPVRPEGRGLLMTPTQERSFMLRMGERYCQAAQLIADHNARSPERPFYENNLANLAREVLGDAAASDSSWTFMADDQGGLWAHPAGYGNPAMRLADASRGNLAEQLRDSLKLSNNDAALLDDLDERYRTLFGACPTCPTPGFCKATAGRAVDAPRSDPLCAWRQTVAKWLSDQPEIARLLLRRPAPKSRRNVAGANGDAPVGLDGVTGAELMLPEVRSVLDRIRGVAPDYYIDDFPRCVTELRAINRATKERVFVQLAVLGRQLRDAHARHLSEALFALAHIGLDPVTVDRP